MDESHLGPALLAFRQAFTLACDTMPVPPTKARVGYDTYDALRSELGPATFLKYGTPPRDDGYGGRLLCELWVDDTTAERMDFEP